MIEKNWELIIGLFVFLVAIAVYLNSLGNGFVWDDDFVILANPALKGSPLALFNGIDSGRMTEIAPYYRPLTLLTFLTEGRLHGFTPYFVRLINVLLHAATAFLVYRLAVSLKIGRNAALIAGLLFAVHPLNSEAVDFNAGGRNTMLAAFFVLAAYLVHQRSIMQGTLRGAYAGAALFLAGLLSKETAVALLPFVGGLEISGHYKGDSASAKKVFIRLLPYIACSTVYLLLRSNALKLAGVSLEIMPGIAARLMNNIFIIPRYLLNVVWPGFLSPKYYIPEDLNLYALLLVFTWICIIGLLLCFFSVGRRPVTLFGLAWLFAFWLPVSGIFPIPSAPLADRYLYTPAIGLWLIIADQLNPVLFKPRIRYWVIGTVTMLLIVLAVVTIRHNMVWRSDVALFTRMIELYPEQAYGYHNLGCAYLDKVKNIDLAEKAFEQALARDSSFPRLKTQLGFIRMQRGQYEGALYQYDQAIYQNALDAEALLNRGTILERLGRYADALDSYRRFLATPGNELPEARRATTLKVEELSRKLLATKQMGIRE